MAHDPCCIGAEQVILHGRPMRSDDDEIGRGFPGDPQNFGIDADAVRDENVGIEVGGIDTPDQGCDPVFEIRGDQIIAQRRCLGLQDGLNLAHDGEDMKPGAKGARELDRREQWLAAGRFIIEVNREQNVLVHVNLAQSVVRPISDILPNNAGLYQLWVPAFSRHNHQYHSNSFRDLRDRRIPCAGRCDRGTRRRHRREVGCCSASGLCCRAW